MRRTAALIVSLLALLALAGCGDDDPAVSADDPGATADEPAEPGATEPAADPLAERAFHVAEVTGQEQVAGSTITMSFADGQVSVEAGCNHLSGGYSLEGLTLVVDEIGGTEMGCDPALMDQDTWIAAFLADRPTVQVQQGEAQGLATDEVTLRFVRPAPEPAQELVGPTWTLDTISEGSDADGTAASIPTGVTAGITFVEDGTYTVEAGCNTGSGTYAEAGAGIYQIDPPSLTRRRCENAAMEVEEVVVLVLDGEVSVSIEGERLTIESGTTGLGFARG